MLFRKTSHNLQMTNGNKHSANENILIFCTHIKIYDKYQNAFKTNCFSILYQTRPLTIFLITFHCNKI